MKAANYARTPDEMANAVHGIIKARGFAPYSTVFDTRVSAMADRQDPRVRQAMNAASPTRDAQQ